MIRLAFNMPVGRSDPTKREKCDDRSGHLNFTERSQVCLWVISELIVFNYIPLISNKKKNAC